MYVSGPEQQKTLGLLRLAEGAPGEEGFSVGIADPDAGLVKPVVTRCERKRRAVAADRCEGALETPVGPAHGIYSCAISDKCQAKCHHEEEAAGL